MNPNTGPDNDESLRKVLRQWEVDTPLPPRFQEQVWRRIERAERAESKAEQGFWTNLTKQVEALVPRPRFALAYLSVFLVLGVTAGAVAAQLKTSKLDSELSQRYVQSIDPYKADTAHR
jgi:hypothetical protein